MHGTKPQLLEDILSNGLSERHCTGGLFGEASYFAEDVSADPDSSPNRALTLVHVTNRARPVPRPPDRP